VLDLAALHRVQPGIELDAVPAGAAIYGVPLPLDRVDGVAALATLDGVGAVVEEEVGRDRIIATLAGELIRAGAAYEVVRVSPAEELVVALGCRRVAVAS